MPRTLKQWKVRPRIPIAYNNVLRQQTSSRFISIQDIIIANVHATKERTHRVRTNAVLLPLTLTLTFELTHQPKTMSLVGYPKVIPYTKFEHFGIIRL